MRKRLTVNSAHFDHAKLIVIDPAEIYVHTDHATKGHYIQKTAVVGMKEVYEILKKI